MEPSWAGQIFVGVWLLACAILLVGAVLVWVYRLPGTTFSDFMNGPKGGHPPRMFHQFADTVRHVRPGKHRLIYWLQLSGATIAALDVLAMFLLAFLK